MTHFHKKQDKTVTSLNHRRGGKYNVILILVLRLSMLPTFFPCLSSFPKKNASPIETVFTLSRPNSPHVFSADHEAKVSLPVLSIPAA